MATTENSEFTPGEDTVQCSVCMEHVPASAVICPACDEPLVKRLSPEQQARLLNEAVTALDRHAADPGKVDADTRMKGGALSSTTVAVLVLLGLSIAAIAFGASVRDGVPLVVIGVILALSFGIAALVALVNDWRANHIADAPTAKAAFQRFWCAVRTKRTAKAYACLAPTARDLPAVSPVMFQKIPWKRDNLAIQSVADLKKYWKAICKGSSGETRTAQLKKVRVVEETADGMAIVEAEMRFTSYPSVLILLIFAGVLIAVILIMILQKRETRQIRKLLIRRNDRWYIADGQFEGPVDGARIA